MTEMGTRLGYFWTYLVNADWSTTADVVTAFVALSGFVFLLWDRFRPRPGLMPTWARPSNSYEPGCREFRLYAVSLASEPIIFSRIVAGPGIDFTLIPTNYSPLGATKAAKDPTFLPSHGVLKFRAALKVRPRAISGVRTDSKYAPLITIIARRSRQGAGERAYVMVEGYLVSNPKRLIRSRTELNFPGSSNTSPTVRIAAYRVWSKLKPLIFSHRT